MLQTVFSLSSIFPEMATGGHQSSGIPFGGAAYKKHMKETVSVEEICNGSLGPKLIQEDFDTALQVL